ncbi:hypothetical protein JZ751_005899 [Albula glossodonta]|uniref:SEA domain-containing protein n=1 Tax=Albula glossodonta TaxID=121402 RepID=A0A8T2PBG2_9TELE|nr:hypothetical protein JZ751_005899 [Albula glossodonta]
MMENLATRESIKTTTAVSMTATTDIPGLSVTKTSATTEDTVNRSTIMMENPGTIESIITSNPAPTIAKTSSVTATAMLPKISTITTTPEDFTAILTSITAALAPTGSLASTLKPAVSITTSPLPELAISLEFHLARNFEEDLKNSSSVTYKELSNNLTKQLDKVFSEKYMKTFKRTKINSFRNGSIVVDATLVFNDISAVPNTRDVEETLIDAVSTSSSSFISDIDNSSIVATIPTTKSPPPEPAISLEFRIVKKFDEDLKNSSSVTYKELSNTLTKQLDMVYSEKYGPRFNRTKINSFRNGSIVVDTTLVFNNISAVPNTSDVAETLKAAATSNNTSNNATLISQVNVSSIVATIPKQTPPMTTRTPTTQQRNTLSLPQTINTKKPTTINGSVVTDLDLLFKEEESKDEFVSATEVLKTLQTALNIDGWVAVTMEFKFIAERKIGDDLLTDAILSSQGPFLYLKHFLVVNDFQAPVDSFSLSLRITSLSFSDDLANRGSQQFLLYSTLIRTAVKKLYADKDGFCDVYVMNMTSGSVVVELAVIFEKIGISSSSVSQILLSGLPQLELDGLMADPNSLQTVSEAQLSSSPRPFPGFAVAIIVMCGFAILLLPVAMVVVRSLRSCTGVTNHKLKPSSSIAGTDGFILPSYWPLGHSGNNSERKNAVCMAEIIHWYLHVIYFLKING